MEFTSGGSSKFLDLHGHRRGEHHGLPLTREVGHNNLTDVLVIHTVFIVAAAAWRQRVCERPPELRPKLGLVVRYLVLPLVLTSDEQASHRRGPCTPLAHATWRASLFDSSALHF